MLGAVRTASPVDLVIGSDVGIYGRQLYSAKVTSTPACARPFPSIPAIYIAAATGRIRLCDGASLT
jgi:hypothetical protein